jgi:hypothetical protein
MGVVPFGPLDLLAGIGNDGVATLVIGLSQDGSHAPGFLSSPRLAGWHQQ